MSYEPPYVITNKILENVSSISEKIGRISLTSNLSTRPHLRKSNRIKSVHSSLKIEANSLSINDVHAIVDGHRVLGSQREIQEVLNAYSAYEELENINPYNLSDLKKYHGIMTEKLVVNAGSFRNTGEGVYDGNRCIFLAPPADMVPVLMRDLFKWMKANKTKIHPLILSSVFHYEFVFIHPFTDGNGRMARLWQTAMLYQWRSAFGYIPIENQIEKYQAKYYKAIEDSHRSGSSTPFIEFMLATIDTVVDDVIIQIDSDYYETTEYVKKLLNVMAFGVPYTSNEIMKKLGLVSKETFRKNYMDPALKLGLVQMTIPDKPTSKNQRYVKNR